MCFRNAALQGALYIDYEDVQRYVVESTRSVRFRNRRFPRAAPICHRQKHTYKLKEEDLTNRGKTDYRQHQWDPVAVPTAGHHLRSTPARRNYHVHGLAMLDIQAPTERCSSLYLDLDQ